MPVFHIAALDGLIQSTGPTISAPAMEKNGHHAAERKPPFSLYSFYPPLYVIPPQQPLPSPSDSSPSPYIVNHKRRGPRQSVADQQHIAAHISQSNTSLFENKANCSGEKLDCEGVTGPAKCRLLEQEESSDIFEIEINGGLNRGSNRADLECLSPISSSAGDEFFDALDAPLAASQSELDKLMIPQWLGERLKHMQAQEALPSLQRQSDAIAQKFLSLALSLPSRNYEEKGTCTTRIRELADVFEHYSQELIVARLVHAAVARGAAKAEKEEELETLLASKNKEIARLRDKLQYYEIVNHEMSHRNQEAVEIAQRRRRRHRKRQKWALSLITGAVCVSTAVFLTYQAGKNWNLKLGSLASHLSAKPCSGLVEQGPSCEQTA